jgi:hypothetical protein
MAAKNAVQPSTLNSLVSLLGVLFETAWVVTNITGGSSQETHGAQCDVGTLQLLGVLGSLIRGDDPEVLANTCLLDGRPNDRIQTVLDAGVLPRVSDHRADAGAALHWQHRQCRLATDTESARFKRARARASRLHRNI